MFTGKVPVSMVILLLLSTNHSNAQSCIDPPVRQRRSTYIDVTCPGGRIFSVDVTAGRGTCEQPKCSGFSPKLLQESLDCYWQNSCRIWFPVEIIVKTEDFINCLGKRPDFLRLESWRCLNMSNKLTDMSSSTPFEQHPSGVIRSHSNYPWDYEYSDFSSGTFLPTGFRNISLPLYLLNNTDLVVSTRKIEIDSKDYLTVATKEKPEGTLLSEDTVTFNKRHERVTIQFLVNIRTNGGPGFIICYVFVPTNYQVHDACEIITNLHGTSSVQNTSPPRMPRHAKVRRRHRRMKTRTGRLMSKSE